MMRTLTPFLIVGAIIAGSATVPGCSSGSDSKFSGTTSKLPEQGEDSTAGNSESDGTTADNEVPDSAEPPAEEPTIDDTPTGEPPADETPADEPPTDKPQKPKMQTGNNLNWKRSSVLEADIATALSMTKQDICTELGNFSCFDIVHLTELGGHNPFSSGAYKGLPTTTLTTPIAFERVTLAACSNKVTTEAAGTKIVFKHIDLAKATDSIAPQDFVNQITELYHRFLLRSPDPLELDALRPLLKDGADSHISNINFAKLSCFVIGTMTETIFY